MDEHSRSSALRFRGGVPGALAPFLVFLGGVSWLGLSGAPDEKGFWPVLLVALMVGLLLSRDRSAYADAVVDGMGRRLVALMVLAWMLAGVLGVLLQGSGLVQSLIWSASALGVAGGGFTASAFVVCMIFSTATGTSLGTILVCAPLLYPAGGALGADPAFLIGAILAGATFGDNVSPISDTTIASATTQRADLGGVVRSRMRYALPAAAVALTAFAVLGGAPTAGGPPAAPTGADPVGLIMLAVPATVLVLLLRRSHLVEGLMYGILLAGTLGLVLGRFTTADLFSIDREAFAAQGLLLDGMRRAVGVSVFTMLVMGLVGGLEASGVLERALAWVRARARSASAAEWWIFGSMTGATLLTTHSAVAIITVGELTRDVGEAAGVDPYRRANILDVVSCTYPFLMPIFIPTILAASMTGGAEGMPRISPWSVGLHNVHSWGLLVVIVLSIATGWGRARVRGETSPATSTSADTPAARRAARPR